MASLDSMFAFIATVKDIVFEFGFLGEIVIYK